ncbi:hypothetical protein GE21DRAFT_9774 [Neurospora crassa]|uniref:Uncharacterized protein n=1 Tax=Neurospora crassa (strain ATCC 24698 / 74-OR23-1A / CBS 708.71 / DSM 1257 / FGSC 987) TaxID=367110 RepID=Q7S0A6_NEUCR|nr:hypothetical protein NCU06872 [Neurospora crassa OR74A]EAA28745.1 hypothetical protein NCU06872 [Neurospora crassa OR74A]KHE86216.1 hypothetical protein GE21DRAFT_9774 [Neurospora crassa]|eukprot:XP_957981.1 hypothetical protein NCU06872 [Neurospora crassa OR74A]
MRLVAMWDSSWSLCCRWTPKRTKWTPDGKDKAQYLASTKGVPRSDCNRGTSTKLWRSEAARMWYNYGLIGYSSAFENLTGTKLPHKLRSSLFIGQKLQVAQVVARCLTGLRQVPSP